MSDADDPGTIPIDDEDAAAAFDALSSGTARTILAALYEQPVTASDLVEDVGTSVQNVSHHLDQLADADLVTVVGTEESAHGQEMERYAPTSDSLALYAPADNEPTLADGPRPTGTRERPRRRGDFGGRHAAERGWLDGSGRPFVAGAVAALAVLFVVRLLWR